MMANDKDSSRSAAPYVILRKVMGEALFDSRIPGETVLDLSWMPNVLRPLHAKTRFEIAAIPSTPDTRAALHALREILEDRDLDALFTFDPARCPDPCRSLHGQTMAQIRRDYACLAAKRPRRAGKDRKQQRKTGSAAAPTFRLGLFPILLLVVSVVAAASSAFRPHLVPNTTEPSPPCPPCAPATGGEVSGLTQLETAVRVLIAVGQKRPGDVLGGIDLTTSTETEVRSARRRMLLAVHPDKVPGDSPTWIREACEEASRYLTESVKVRRGP